LAIRKVDSVENKIICYPISFLVDRINKYQKDKQQHISIETIEKNKRNKIF
jgi:hypothetical protein